MGRRKQTAESMMSHVQHEGECWLWTGCKDKDGYGLSSIGGKKMPAHRAMWTLVHGAPSLYILHKCHNRNCVNPKHLYEGTQKQNVQDQIDAGTFVIGEKNGVALLNEAAVRHIRVSSFSNEALGKYYGVSHHTIYDVRKNRSWKHVK
jgi:hypothetical protein